MENFLNGVVNVSAGIVLPSAAIYLGGSFADRIADRCDMSHKNHLFLRTAAAVTGAAVLSEVLAFVTSVKIMSIATSIIFSAANGLAAGVMSKCRSNVDFTFDTLLKIPNQTTKVLLRTLIATITGISIVLLLGTVGIHVPVLACYLGSITAWKVGAYLQSNSYCLGSASKIKTE